MSQFVSTPTKTKPSAAATAANLLLYLNSSGKWAKCGTTNPPLAVSEFEVFAADIALAGRLRTAQGTFLLTVSDAITKGDPVYAGASGKGASSGTVLVARALETSTADGDVIECVWSLNSDVSASVGGTTAAAFIVDSDSTTPKIELAAQSGGTGDYKGTIKPPSTLTANRVYTLPADQNTTLVGDNTTQTLSSKTLSSPSINFPVATVVVGGTAIGNANAVAEGFTVVTGADNTAAVKLPAAVAGLACTIKSTESGKILCVFPAVNDAINGAAANAVYNMANLSQRTFFALDATNWYTDPETPT